MTRRSPLNVLLIVADDHAPAAIGCYGSPYHPTPRLDGLASEGAVFENCFCTNALCTPARASILTGQYSHVNGVRTLHDRIDQTHMTTLPKLLQAAGYQTGFAGKWHLGHGGASDPAGFDYWNVLPVQGTYVNTRSIEMGRERQHSGYATDLIAGWALDWIRRCDPGRPFYMQCAFSAPHDPFRPAERHGARFRDTVFPEPASFDDVFEGRPACAGATMKVARMHEKNHLPEPRPAGLSGRDLARWNYQCFMRNYLRCVAAIDENVGRLLDGLAARGVADDTVVIYTSDHGFFLGEHGWYDKRFMHEPSIRIPFIIRYPREIRPGTRADAMALNVDFAPTVLDLCGQPVPAAMQGRSLRRVCTGQVPGDWRQAMYYQYWMHLAHFNVPAHCGVRTRSHKLIHYYGRALGAAGALEHDTEPCWELYDLGRDPLEMRNVYGEPAYAAVTTGLAAELARQRAALGLQPAG